MKSIEIPMSVPVGTVIDFAGSNVPRGYLECDGREVLRVMYPLLFDAIGVVWGNGDGSTTFNVPDLRGRTTLGVMHNAGQSGANANLMRTDRAQHMDDAYDTMIIPLSSNLATNTTYTIQLWDVRVRHTGKDSSNIGLSAYLAGGSIQLATWNGVSTHYDSYDSNLHVARARYLKATFTTASSLASNGSIFLYNSVGSAAGYSEISIGKWKLEAGSNATPWTPNEITSGFELADAGGERKFIMRTSQMPGHAHGMNDHKHSYEKTNTPVTGGTHSHPLSGSGFAKIGNYSERIAFNNSGVVSTGKWSSWSGTSYTWTHNADTSLNSSHSHYADGYGVGLGGATDPRDSHTHNLAYTSTSTGGSSANSTSTGGGSASPLMQPYAVVRKVIRAY